MSGNLWMFSDMLDDEDIEMQKHDFITLYQGADYYGLGLKSFTRMAREAGAVYKIGKKVLIRRTIFDEYLRKIYKKEMEQKALDDAEKDLVMRQGTMVTDEESGRMDIRFGLMDYYGGLHCGECLDVLVDTTAFINFKFRFFISFTKANLTWQIDIPYIKQTGIDVVINCFFTTH